MQIVKQVQKALLNPKIYNSEIEFFELDQKKILLTILKDKLKLSYAKLGKEFNLTWYPVFISCRISRKKYPHILDKIMKVIK